MEGLTIENIANHFFVNDTTTTSQAKAKARQLLARLLSRPLVLNGYTCSILKPETKGNKRYFHANLPKIITMIKKTADQNYIDAILSELYSQFNLKLHDGNNRKDFSKN
jgi:hypothetical protein